MLSLTRLGFIVNLARCVGCQTCIVACLEERNAPAGVTWIRIIEVFVNGKIYYVPLLCGHCDDPPCMKSCPNKAIYRSKYEILKTDYRTCKGQKVCVKACPYGVRMVMNGLGSSCDLCEHRLTMGLKPICIESCPTGALSFEDIDYVLSTRGDGVFIIDVGNVKPRCLYFVKSRGEAEVLANEVGRILQREFLMKLQASEDHH